MLGGLCKLVYISWGTLYVSAAKLLQFLCFGNEASRDRFVGRSVGLLVTNFKKVPKMICAPVDCLLI